MIEQPNRVLALQEANASPFETGHYAASAWQKVKRSFQLGPKYYFWDLPRYFGHRRSLGLGTWDTAALISPIWEFSRRHDQQLPLPPGYADALGALAGAGVQLTIPRRRLEPLLGCWWDCRTIDGDMIECGSYRGATGLMIALLGQMHRIRQEVLLLDTFSGTPATSPFDVGRQAGEFVPSADQVAAIAHQAQQLGIADRIRIHQGLFSDSFARMADRANRFAFVHIDANIYQGTLEACEFTMPRTLPGGIVVFDDYNGVCDLGARLAIQNYCRGREGLWPRMLAGSSAYVRMPPEQE
jgi:O-methyltransferase